MPQNGTSEEREPTFLHEKSSKKVPGSPPDPLPGKPLALREPRPSGNTPEQAKGVFGVSPSGCLRTALMGPLCRGINGVLFWEMGVLF